jgi:hypothetical protein
MAALRWGTTALALAFIGLVLVCPHVDSDDRVVRLFADDVVLRRVSVASAIGLVVTANIFFRPRGRTDSEFDEYLRRADPD